MQRDDDTGAAVTVTSEQLRLLLAAYDSAGAHFPDECVGDCPAPVEHAALALLQDLFERRGGQTSR